MDCGHVIRAYQGGNDTSSSFALFARPAEKICLSISDLKSLRTMKLSLFNRLKSELCLEAQLLSSLKTSMRHSKAEPRNELLWVPILGAHLVARLCWNDA